MKSVVIPPICEPTKYVLGFTGVGKFQVVLERRLSWNRFVKPPDFSKIVIEFMSCLCRYAAWLVEERKARQSKVN